MSKFVIGIGSQRTGTTLIHQILDECTSIFMHPVKELHYFDTLFSVRSEVALKKYARAELQRSTRWNLNVWMDSNQAKRHECLVRTLKLLATRSVTSFDYIDLYRPCISENPILGEITPEYMILPEQGVQNLSENVGKDAKIILIARHPVMRFISSVKLLAAHNDAIKIDADFGVEISRIQREMPAWVEVQSDLSDYESALYKYRAHFDNVLFLSYDNLIGYPDKTHAELEQFLTVSIDKARYKKILKKKINSLGNTQPVPAATVSLLSKKFEKSIDFLHANFGKGNCDR